MRKYFGTDGIRGIADTELTSEFVYKVAKAGAYVIAKKSNHTPTILIGRDTRISGVDIEKSMIKGFLDVGANVKTLGIIPTPALAYLTKKINADVGVIISASHNTFEFNGIKFFSNKGMKIDDELEEKIEQILESKNLENLYISEEKKVKSEIDENLIYEYLNFIKNIFEKDFERYNKKRLKVLIDTANGATSKIAEKVFTSLKIKYKIINNNPNGKNINKNCGSTHIENIKKIILEEKFDLGIAYDGDGDRCLAMDEKGNIINGDKILAVISNYFKEKNILKNNTIVATVMSNMGLNEYTDKNNINLIQTKVGDRYVLEELIKNNYNLGGEQSGHIILLDYNPTGDGILTSLMIIKILLEKDISASEISKIINEYPQVIVNAKVRSDKKIYINDLKIKKEIDEIKQQLGKNGRILVRPSGTEPLIRIMIEGKNIEQITQQAYKIAELIEKN